MRTHPVSEDWPVEREQFLFVILYYRNHITEDNEVQVTAIS